MESVIFPNLVRVRVGLAPRSQPFDECMDSLNVAMMYAQSKGFNVSLEKVRGGVPGFQNWGPFLHHFIESGDTHIFNACDDIVFPHDAIVRLISHDKDVVTGIYRKNDLKGIQPANYIETAEEFHHRFRDGGLFETPYASGHSMTIKRHVIEKMILDYPELAYKQGEETHFALFMPMIEDRFLFQDDWSFSVRARKSGFTLWDDYSCKLKHHCCDFLGFEAMEAEYGRSK